MKKIFTLIAAVLLFGNMTASAQSMKVTLTDGTEYVFQTDDVKTVEFAEGPADNKENGFEYVDLGLPSGTLWAKYNVGASAVEEAGDYFAWGEVETKEIYTNATYKYGAPGTDEGDFDILNGLTKYNYDPALGPVDDLMELLPEDDAAHVNMGGRWHTPTYDQIYELATTCLMQKTKVNGVPGCKFTGSNGNSIFLPSVGLRNAGIVMFNDAAMKFGFYWASSLSPQDATMACYIFSEQTGANMMGYSFRYYGQPVRAVFNK